MICVQQPHQGLAAARNAGIGASKGELLVFLDADDRLLPNALESGLECLRAHPDCGFVFGAHRTIAAGGGRPEPARLPTIHRDMYLDLLSQNCVAMHGTVLFRRDAVLAVDKSDPTLAASEDYDLCLRISRRFPVACHSHVIAEYWKHEGNMSADSGLMLRESLRALRKQKPALESAEQRAAFREGIRHWQHYYGERQWATVTRSLKGMEIAAASRRALVLLRFAPSVFAAQAAKQSRYTFLALARGGVRVDLSADSLRRNATCSNERHGRSIRADGQMAQTPARPGTRSRRSFCSTIASRTWSRIRGDWPCLHATFATRCDCSPRRGRCIPLSELVRQLGRGQLPAGSVSITFDDGYSDNLLNAKPILEEFALPATFFLTSGYLQGDNDFWWDALERPFFQKMRIPATLEIEIERALLTFDFAGDTEYRELAFAGHRQWRAWDPPPSKRHLVYHQLWQILHRLPSATRERLVDTIQDWAGANVGGAGSASRPLSSAQVRQLASGAGIEIGGHTVTHPSLPLLDRDAQQREIVENKRRLEELLEQPVRHFSYPHGELSDDTVSLLKQAGYGAACHDQAFAIGRSADLFRLPRICVEDWELDEFAEQIETSFCRAVSTRPAGPLPKGVI